MFRSISDEQNKKWANGNAEMPAKMTAAERRMTPEQLLNKSMEENDYWDMYCYPRKIRLLYYAAESGNVTAQFLLADEYLYGRETAGYSLGFQKNIPKAEYYYTKAAEQGHGDACNKLIELYIGGEYVNQNYAKAIDLCKKVPTNKVNGIMCCVLLGNWYFSGKVVKQDYKEAFQWYKMASDFGDGDGQAYLGCMYKNGQYVKINYNEAFRLFTLSAKNDNIKGLAFLGYMYEQGLGVKKDLIRAVDLYKKAVKKNDYSEAYTLANSRLSELHKAGLISDPFETVRLNEPQKKEPQKVFSHYVCITCGDYLGNNPNCIKCNCLLGVNLTKPVYKYI